MQKVLVLSKDTDLTEDFNFNDLETLLLDGWKVISSENILDWYSCYAGAASYTYKIVYILEKE